MTSMTKPLYAGTLEIDLAAIADNYALIRGMVKGGVCAPTVKADAYGLGAREVTRALIDAGARTFFVATPEEGMALADLEEGLTFYVLGGFFEECGEGYLRQGLIPILNSLEEVRAYQGFAARAGKHLACGLHFNTAMNRLGLDADEIAALHEDKSLLEGLEITLVMSHFASSEEADNPLNETQRTLFEGQAAPFKALALSMANSSGVFLGQPSHFDLVRVGASLYGVNPTPHLENPMKAAAHLSAPVLKTYTARAGEAIGYNQTYRFEKDTVMACVAAGYADGIFRSLSNSGAFYWKGYRCPIRGRVSMDLACVDLSGVPEAKRPCRGDHMEILGTHQGVDDLARDAGTIGYEVLTALGQRYKRIYKP